MSRILHFPPPGAQHSPCFVLEERSRPHAAVQVVLSDNVIDGMIDNLRFNFDRINISIMNSVSLACLGYCALNGTDIGVHSMQNATSTYALAQNLCQRPIIRSVAF